MSNIVQITDSISYLPASRNPLSCDVVFIKTDECTWIYDVGSCKEAVEEINKVEGIKKIVISHFHPDHIFNLLRVKYDELYVTRYTKKYTFKGTVIEGEYKISDDLRIFELPSSHAKGCLAIESGNYVFLGDGTYAKERKGNHTYNTQLLKAEIDVLESLKSEYVCLDHDENFIQSRKALIQLHKQIYGRHKGNESVISVEDFFNPDGSVKKS